MPADGHFNPLTGVAAHLAERGHDVRWYAGPEYGPKVEVLGMPWFPYQRANEVTAGNLNARFPERSGLKGPKRLAFDLEKFFVSNVEAHFLDVVDIRSSFPFDILLCDGAFYAEKLVAERMDVPVFAIGLSTVIPDEHGPPPFFGLRPARTVVGRVVHAVVRRMIGSTLKPGVETYNRVLAANEVAPIPADGFPHAPMAAARRVFLNGSPGLEFPGYQPPPNAQFVGALVPARTALATGASVPEAVRRPGATVVAVSQGTVDNTDPDKLLVPTLEALAGSGHVVVATTGGVGTTELRQRFGAPDVIIEDFIDYEELFPSVDVFVSNGGFGSVLAAFRHGVPVVAAGTREGKNDINARIAYNRLGIDLRSEHPKAARIAAAVRRLLADERVKTNVDRLRIELDSYQPMQIVEDALLAEQESRLR
jgi:UDP:flavonoid glycosyltransferase YjiC (YdhE family)